MDPRRVLLFRDVVRAGSISAAARQLGWTQPALSQHLQALEREVGGALLIRGPRGVEPTEAGRALLVRADAVAGELHMAGEELAALANLRRGRVRLAAYPSAAATLVPRALARLRAEHAGLDVELAEAEPPEAIGMIASGDVDLALLFGYEEGATGTSFEQAAAAAGLTGRELGREEVCLVLPPGHRLVTRRRVGPGDLAAEQWVAGCARCREHLVVLAAQAGFVPEVRHTTDDYVVVQHLVAAGLGVALLPRSALTAYRHPDVVVRDDAAWGRRWYAVAHRPGAQTVPANAALLAELGSAATGTPAGDRGGRGAA